MSIKSVQHTCGSDDILAAWMVTAFFKIDGWDDWGPGMNPTADTSTVYDYDHDFEDEHPNGQYFCRDCNQYFSGSALVVVREPAASPDLLTAMTATSNQGTTQ